MKIDVNIVVYENNKHEYFVNTFLKKKIGVVLKQHAFDNARKSN